MPGSMPLVILKLGGSVITDRGRDRPRLRGHCLRQVAREIGREWKTERFRLLVIHGAGSFGHPIVRRTGIHQGLHRREDGLAMGETQRLQSLLNTIVVRCLLREGVPAFPFQPSASAVMDSGRLASMETGVLLGLLSSGLVPVLNGVPAHDLRQGCAILSGDRLAAYLADKLEASLVLHGTNVPGIFTQDPTLHPDARFLPELDLGPDRDLPAGLGGSAVTDVTGGMRKKIEVLQEANTDCMVFDATVEGNVRKALSGERVGTLLRWTALGT